METRRARKEIASGGVAIHSGKVRQRAVLQITYRGSIKIQ